MNEPNALMTRDEVTARLRCKRSKLYVLMDNAGFPRPFKIGRANIWYAYQVEDWIKRQAAKGEAGELSPATR